MAIVGCAQVVEDGHGPALMADPRFEVCAVADPVERRRERVGDQLGVAPCRRFENHESLTSEDIDAALIATPPHVRRPIVEHLAGRGIDIVSEKPLATTLADADSILTTMRTERRRLAMVHNYPHLREFRLVADAIDRGDLGVVQSVLFRALGAPGRNGAPEYKPQWRWDPAVSGGGRMMDLGIHALNLAEVFLGSPCRSVAAQIVPWKRIRFCEHSEPSVV